MYNAYGLSLIHIFRDFYSNLDEFCKAKDADKQEIIEKLKMIEYTYDEEKNQFV